MDESGVSENIGSILMIFVLVVLAGVVMAYAMDIGGSSAIADYHPQYAIVNAEVIPGLSAPGNWDDDSIKIKFIAGNELDLEYEEVDWSYSGTEGIKFMLIDPNGVSHEAVQSVTMKGQGISPGAVFYYFIIPPNIHGQYYITNDYSRIGDDTNWVDDGWSYLVPFADGTWRVQIIDDNIGTIIADEKVVV